VTHVANAAARVSQLAQLAFEVSDLPRWECFAAEILGLAVADRRDDGTLALRCDERAQRIVLKHGPADDVWFLGFEAPDAAALGAIAERLAADGRAVREATAAVCAARRMTRVLQTEDPSGLPIEIGCGPALAAESLRPHVIESGFVTGDGGVGHAVVAARDPAASERFYCDGLGMRLSDRIVQPLVPTFTLEITFLHANPRHHSIAFANAPLPKRLHHFMLEVRELDDVGHAYDRCVDAGVPIRQGLGRHPNDGMFSFYAETPSGFLVEIGWGGVRIDDATWQAREYDRTSRWGHRPPLVSGGRP
jgi:2,3-dihydroxybiphenyl 1,2-dioxygenase